VPLAFVWDKIGNGATYGDEILHTDPCHTCVGHGSDVDWGHLSEENVLS